MALQGAVETAARRAAAVRTPEKEQRDRKKQTAATPHHKHQGTAPFFVAACVLSACERDFSSVLRILITFRKQQKTTSLQSRCMYSSRRLASTSCASQPTKPTPQETKEPEHERKHRKECMHVRRFQKTTNNNSCSSELLCDSTDNLSLCRLAPVLFLSEKSTNRSFSKRHARQAPRPSNKNHRK